MKRIIVLKGKENTGKSSKIVELYKWMIDNFDCNYEGRIKEKNGDIFGTIDIGTLTIGFNSAGDNEEEVKRIDDLLKLPLPNKEPHIIICACRTKGKPYWYLRDNYSNSSEYLTHFIRLRAYPSAETESIKKRDDRILNELKTLLIGIPLRDDSTKKTS